MSNRSSFFQSLELAHSNETDMFLVSMALIIFFISFYYFIDFEPGGLFSCMGQRLRAFDSDFSLLQPMKWFLFIFSSFIFVEHRASQAYGVCFIFYLFTI